LYEVIDQLFAKADKNNDTVKSIVQSVANHFHLSIVDKSTKKIIKTMLIYLASIQSLNTGGTEGGSREALPTDFGRGGEGGSVGGGTAEAEEGRDSGKDGALFDGGSREALPHDIGRGGEIGSVGGVTAEGEGGRDGA